MTFRFLHAADLHLDTPFSGVGRYPDHVRGVLQEASLAAFDELIRVAVDREVAFCVFAGDIYDGAERGVRAQRRFRDGLARLADLGIASFVAHGNHDPVHEGWSAGLLWPDAVTFFPADTPSKHEVLVDGQLTAIVHGVSFGTQHEQANLALRFARDPRPVFQVGVLHCNVDGDASHARYAECTTADLTGIGLHYWALGHIHQRSARRVGPSWIVYPGNLQGRSPRPSEHGAKGAVIVTVDGTGASATATEPEFVALDQVRFATVDIDPAAFAELQTVTDLEDVLHNAALEAMTAVEGRSLIVRSTLRGRGPLHTDLHHADVLPDLLEALRERSGRTVEPLLWWDRIHNESSPDIDVDAVRRRNDFVADLFATVDQMSAAAAAPAAATSPPTVPTVPTFEGFVPKLPPYLRKAFDDLPEPSDPEIVQAAIVTALDLLVGDDA